MGPQRGAACTSDWRRIMPASNTQPFAFVDTDSVVEDVLRGLGLYTCGPDECAGSLDISTPAPNTSTIYGTVTVSYCTPGTPVPYPFTVSEIEEITHKVKQELKRLIAGLKVYDVEFENAELPCIHVHWKSEKSLSSVINDAKEALALSDTDA